MFVHSLNTGAWQQPPRFAASRPTPVRRVPLTTGKSWPETAEGLSARALEKILIDQGLLTPGGDLRVSKEGDMVCLGFAEHSDAPHATRHLFIRPNGHSGRSDTSFSLVVLPVNLGPSFDSASARVVRGRTMLQDGGRLLLQGLDGSPLERSDLDLCLIPARALLHASATKLGLTPLYPAPHRSRKLGEPHDPPNSIVGTGKSNTSSKKFRLAHALFAGEDPAALLGEIRRQEPKPEPTPATATATVTTARQRARRKKGGDHQPELFSLNA